MTTNPDAIHKFERAGLGKAPFKFIGWYKSVFQAVPGDPRCPIQPGSSCDYCGQGIMYVCRVRGADGREFKVGCDCVEKTGDRGLMKLADAAQRKHDREARHAREAGKIEAARKALADPAVREALAAKPHPDEWGAKAGKTLLEWALWMMDHAGNSGKVKVERAIRAARAT